MWRVRSSALLVWSVSVRSHCMQRNEPVYLDNKIGGDIMMVVFCLMAASVVVGYEIGYENGVLDGMERRDGETD